MAVAVASAVALSQLFNRPLEGGRVNYEKMRGEGGRRGWGGEALPVRGEHHLELHAGHGCCFVLQCNLRKTWLPPPKGGEPRPLRGDINHELRRPGVCGDVLPHTRSKNPNKQA